VAKGIEVLDNPNGFFMMAECGKIDWSCHANDAVATINDVMTLDKAVEVAYQFYQKHPDETLIVVTGDHETGGMAMGFAGTHYDAFLKKLANQKGSYIAFDAIIADYKVKNPSAQLEDFLPTIADFFGLTRYSAAEYAELEASAQAGDVAAYEKLGMALKDYEIADLRKAFEISIRGKKDPANEEYYLSYGDYEPLSVTLTHIMGKKAGVSFTSFSHSGLPTPVSVIGVGNNMFNGYYDNTDIFKKVVAIGKLQ
jgi:alkaline phosphatase